MTAAERKQLIKHGMQRAIAEKHSYSRGWISEVANGKANPTPKAKKIAVLFARKVGVPVKELFPEYYGEAA